MFNIIQCTTLFLALLLYIHIYIYFEFKSRNIIDKLHNRFDIQYSIFYPIF